MITIHLDPTREERLRQLAESQGQDKSQFAQRVLEARAWPEDSSDDWADASIALTPEILPKDDLEEGNIPDGAR